MKKIYLQSSQEITFGNNNYMIELLRLPYNNTVRIHLKTKHFVF